MLQYRGKNAISKFKNDNQEKTGQSLCSILGCCSGVDLECWGCHPGLLAMGMPCDYYAAIAFAMLVASYLKIVVMIILELVLHFMMYGVSESYFHQKNDYFRNQKAVFGQKIQLI